VRRLGELTSSPTELGMLLQWLVDADALLGALDLELDSSTAAGDAAERALIEVAAWEPSRTNALAAVGSRGRSIGPAVRADPALSARIATMRSLEMSLQAIADALNADGVPTLRRGSTGDRRAFRPPSATNAAQPARAPSRSGRGEARQPERARTLAGHDMNGHRPTSEPRPRLRDAPSAALTPRPGATRTGPRRRPSHSADARWPRLTRRAPVPPAAPTGPSAHEEN